MYFLTKKHISRRLALKGLGVSVGLPFLDAMVPAATALAKTAAARKVQRVGFFYMPHGAIMYNTALGEAADAWTCSGAGPTFKLSPILEPLEKYKSQLVSFGHLEDAASAGSVHTINPATWLCCQRPDPNAVGAKLATTLDQIIASKIGQDTPLSSLEVASETTIQAAACNGAGGACYYSSTISFRNPTSPLPMEFNPHKVFLELFGEGDTPAERAAIVKEDGSILDLIAERTKALQAELGPADRAILDNHLEAVREIERRLQKSQSSPLTDVKLPQDPPGVLPNFDDQVKMMFDLIAVAYQAHLTRVVSFIQVAEGTDRTYPFIGVPDAFHPLSHHANDPAKIARLVKIQRYHVQRFADFLDKIAAIKEGEGNALDNALFLWGSNMSNSDRHNNYPLPEVLVGGAGGRLKGGQFVDLPPHTPLANLHLTILDKVGMPREKFADSTGIIQGV